MNYNACKKCGKEFKRKRNTANIYCSRPCAFEDSSFQKAVRALIKSLQKIKVIECRNCKQELKTNKNIKYCSDACREESNRIVVANRKRNREKECKVCSKVFYPEYKCGSYTYCSPECEGEALRVMRRENKQKRKYRNRVLKHSGKFDNSITLSIVINKYNNVCYLCGVECNSDDYIVTEEGHYIIGPSYPSIDHVHPISKGGSHTWDNVNLAHCGCNSDKSDKVLFNKSGQTTLSL